MKAHEETWSAILCGNACECPSSIQVDVEGCENDGDTILYANDGGRARAMHSRLRLAAAAPEMARLLLEYFNDRDAVMPEAAEALLKKAGVLS